MRRGALSLAFAAAFVVAAVSAIASASAQSGFDRPGGDYAHFSVRSGDPSACAARCDREGRCRAWSFAYPTATATGVCYLKNAVPARAEGDCCVSGIRGGGIIEPRGATEFSIDRNGGDYRSFDVPPQAKGEACAAACTAEGRCRAWTYLRPGYYGAAARCYLKGRLTRPRPRPCCISGVVR